ncbi:hypothetical protein [Streptomyces fradiae]|uniref:hypothetical protein n=1 Tax=Streptomyces fradiae TaxID=1906 RepID=UPI00380990AA
MTTPRRPHLKSLTPAAQRPRSAEPTPTRGGSGAAKVAAEGVRSGPDAHPVDGRHIVAMLHITAPAWRGGDPSAISYCVCGRHKTARGEHAVAAMVADHTAHRATCPLQTERRAAA